jgi:GH18 family chitinase
VNYAKSKGLGGVFCWSLDDDPQGTLLKAMTGSSGTWRFWIFSIGQKTI